MSYILGISAFYHDSAACILKDGEIIAAAQEERFTRKKHDPSYPHNAIEFVLKYANLRLNEVDQIVFFEKPFLKFERLLETYVAFAPKGFISFSKAMPLWIKEKLFQKNLLFNKLKETHTLIVVEHDMGFVKEISDIVSVMHEGKLLAEGKTKEIENNEKVKEAYLGNKGITNA